MCMLYVCILCMYFFDTFNPKCDTDKGKQINYSGNAMAKNISATGI